MNNPFDDTPCPPVAAVRANLEEMARRRRRREKNSRFAAMFEAPPLESCSSHAYQQWEDEPSKYFALMQRCMLTTPKTLDMGPQRPGPGWCFADVTPISPVYPTLKKWAKVHGRATRRDIDDGFNVGHSTFVYAPPESDPAQSTQADQRPAASPRIDDEFDE